MTEQKIATNSKEFLELTKKAKKGDTIILDEREHFDYSDKLVTKEESKIIETRTEKLENLLKLMTEQMIKVFESNNLLLVENLRLMKENEELKK